MQSSQNMWPHARTCGTLLTSSSAGFSDTLVGRGLSLVSGMNYARMGNPKDLRAANEGERRMLGDGRRWPCPRNKAQELLAKTGVAALARGAQFCA